MSGPRSIRRNMERRAAAETQVDSLAGQNYRVRRLIIKAELDVYTPEGVLLQRGLTDDLTIHEAEFPQAIMEYFINRGMLVEGFKTYQPPEPTPTPED